jgi:putative hydrolase of the HAD superfamily
MTNPTIEVVMFDLDDTLFAHSKAVATGVAAHRRAHGGAMAAADEQTEFARWTALEEHHYHRYLSGELGFMQQRRERARGFVEPYGLDLSDETQADEWFGRYLAQYRLAWELHPDTLPLLNALSQRLGVITNAELGFQRSKLDAMGISSRMEHVIASGEVGYAKPDARIFLHALEAFGVEPAQAAYVGDRLHTDAIGAASAGLLGVWVDRRGSATDDERTDAAAAGVPIIQSLAEVPALLEMTAK